ncbi:MAG: PDC sensor domain-containing protein [Candidatus Auribacterota bacterium]
MKTITLTAIAIIALCCTMISAQEKAPQEVIDLANTELAALGADPVIVAAVKAENAKGKTQDEIKAIDAEWQNTSGFSDFMTSLMNSDCGKHLKEIMDSEPYFAEIFVMDNQGANVAMSAKTSDYWQGDEAKFTESFKDGQGAIHISDVKFDDSSQSYVVQVSIPVKDGDTVIGAMTIGIDIDQL